MGPTLCAGGRGGLSPIARLSGGHSGVRRVCGGVGHRTGQAHMQVRLGGLRCTAHLLSLDYIFHAAQVKPWKGACVYSDA